MLCINFRLLFFSWFFRDRRWLRATATAFCVYVLLSSNFVHELLRDWSREVYVEIVWGPCGINVVVFWKQVDRSGLQRRPVQGCAMLVQYVYGLRAHNSFKCVYSSHIADITFSTWPQILPCADNRRGQQAHGHRDRQLSPPRHRANPRWPKCKPGLVQG